MSLLLISATSVLARAVGVCVVFIVFIIVKIQHSVCSVTLLNGFRYEIVLHIWVKTGIVTTLFPMLVTSSNYCKQSGFKVLYMWFFKSCRTQENPRKFVCEVCTFCSCLCRFPLSTKTCKSELQTLIHLVAHRCEGDVFVLLSSVTDWQCVKSVSILLPTLYQ